MITQRRDIQPALDHLEAALEATCATLIVLESASLDDTHRGAESSGVQHQIRQSIDSLREAMTELRALHEVETSMLAFGFVLGADRARPRAHAASPS